MPHRRGLAAARKSDRLLDPLLRDEIVQKHGIVSVWPLPEAVHGSRQNDL